MPDSAVVARGRRRAQELGETRRPRKVRQPLAGPSRTTTNLTEQPVYADASDVAEFAANLSGAFLLCRELGHPWKPGAGRVVDGSIERRLKCPRCKTEKVQILTLGGGIHSYTYEYPDGYLVEGLGRIVGEGRDRLRCESLMRSMPEEDRKEFDRLTKAAARKSKAA